MGYAQPIAGHVTTVTRGISVSNAATGAQGLPNVDPVYTWVRLAQRVPVRIAIDKVPPGVPLVSGMTTTVTILDAAGSGRRSGVLGLLDAVGERLSDVLYGPPARAGCIPAISAGHGPIESLPPDQVNIDRSPGEIDPGLTPGMNDSPNLRRQGAPVGPMEGEFVDPGSPRAGSSATHR